MLKFSVMPLAALLSLQLLLKKNHQIKLVLLPIFLFEDNKDDLSFLFCSRMCGAKATSKMIIMIKTMLTTVS